jgi:hypothetical protein
MMQSSKILLNESVEVPWIKKFRFAQLGAEWSVSNGLRKKEKKLRLR